MKQKQQCVCYPCARKSQSLGIFFLFLRMKDVLLSVDEIRIYLYKNYTLPVFLIDLIFSFLRHGLIPHVTRFTQTLSQKNLRDYWFVQSGKHRDLVVVNEDDVSQWLIVSTPSSL